MIIELWMTDIMDHRSKLIATESILFSISKNEEELNDLNKLVEYLVQLQNIQRREKEVTQLLREKHTEQAYQAKKVLVDEVQKTVSSLANEKPKNEQEKETLEYIIHQANVIHRRSMSMETLFEQDGITNEELLLQNEYYTKFNAKFRKSYDDL
jgi:hypothetical protein